jgi:hypothetical protein
MKAITCDKSKQFESGDELTPYQQHLLSYVDRLTSHMQDLIFRTAETLCQNPSNLRASGSNQPQLRVINGGAA